MPRAVERTHLRLVGWLAGCSRLAPAERTRTPHDTHEATQRKRWFCARQQRLRRDERAALLYGRLQAAQTRTTL